MSNLKGNIIMKNKTIFFRNWPSTGHLDTHLAKSLRIGLTCSGILGARTSRRAGGQEGRQENGQATAERNGKEMEKKEGW